MASAEIPALVALGGVGAVVAWAIPQSIALPAAGGRVGIVLAAVVVGALASRRTGLAVRPHGAQPLLRGVLAGLAFGVYAAIADGVLFRAQVPAAQIASAVGVPAWQRIVVLVPLVVVDEVVYRFGLLSAFVIALSAFRAESGKPTARIFVVAIVADAVLYVVLHLAHLTGGTVLTPPIVAREVAVHVFAGCLWGFLCCRHGLATAIFAHASP
jgi:hypothetical protein